jgi:Uma2 family endonuclease
MRELPEFDNRPPSYATNYIQTVLAGQLKQLVSYDDGHFRAYFNPDYFTGADPSKSQWNTLKKRMKRINPQVFVFKNHGESTGEEGERLLYVDFGFFAN